MDAGTNRGATRAWCWMAALLMAVLAGCALSGTRTVWDPPLSPPPDRTASGPAAVAEANFSAGIAADAAGDPAAIDYYFAAARAAWPLEVTGATVPGDPGAALYRASVRKMLDAAARCGRFDSSRGVTLGDGHQIPVRYFGFLWESADFHAMLPVGWYASREFNNRYATNGVGVEYVVVTGETPRQPFIGAQQPFAATAVLAPASASPGGFTLDFYDPLRTTATDTGLPLARDLTAPIAYGATQNTDQGILDFLDPARNDDRATLSMIEPYQQGKIPIVLVHGLASSPVTWSHLQNELRGQSAILARYQIWVFRYDTGAPFLTSAAELRRQLAELRQTYDPGRADPEMSRMVIIGHSLGGLVSKLQVTYSSDTLWQSAATQPFNTIRTDPATRARLGESFFFSPSPDISRVIYIATPHRGSVYARRCVGRLSSALVKEPPESQARHAQLVRDNPGAFREEIERGIPTSVDLLEPTNRILDATNRLPYRAGVPLHSIIGDDRWTLTQGRTDGVVSVASAELQGVQSQVFIDSSHTGIQANANTSAEVERILLLHAAAGM